MIDVDRFKPLNDYYGHAAGDAALREVAARLREHVRASDIVARYGGEEFGVILGNTDAESAIIFCERVRKQVEAVTVVHDNQEIKFTVSLGISQAAKSTSDYKAWLEQADQALYAGKEGEVCSKTLGRAQ